MRTVSNRKNPVDCLIYKVERDEKLQTAIMHGWQKHDVKQGDHVEYMGQIDLIIPGSDHLFGFRDFEIIEIVDIKNSKSVPLHLVDISTIKENKRTVTNFNRKEGVTKEMIDSTRKNRYYSVKVKPLINESNQKQIESYSEQINKK